MIKTLADLQAILADVVFEDWRFRTGQDQDGVFWVQCAFVAPDNDTGLPAEQRGRKWRISQWMTRDEVVQTCLLATIKAVEHEVRERFKYRGHAIFHTHLPVDDLVAIAERKSRRPEVAGA